MKTKGLEVHKGVLVVGYSAGMVPVQFWNRLKHRIILAGLKDAYLAEYREQLDVVMAQRETPLAPGAKRLDEDAREARMFRRWSERVCGPQRIWPWDLGWTEDLVDAYLLDDDKKMEAA